MLVTVRAGCRPSGAPRRRRNPQLLPSWGLSAGHAGSDSIRWEDAIVTAGLTGVTNATSESLNRIAKLEARMDYGFRNPENQRRRVRIACTRGTRRPSPNATKRAQTTCNQP